MTIKRKRSAQGRKQSFAKLKERQAKAKGDK